MRHGVILHESWDGPGYRRDMTRIRFAAHVVRGTESWVVYLPAVDRALHADSLEEVEPLARDLLVDLLDVDPDAVDVELVRPAIPAQRDPRASGR